MKILDSNGKDFDIVVGRQTTELILRFDKLSVEERETLLNETASILSKCPNPKGGAGSNTGIVIGYVQSGKTMSFTTLTALAIDNGVRVIIYFAGIKNNLLEQTTKRLKKDLLTESDNRTNYKVFQSPNLNNGDDSVIKRALGQNSKPAILITVLKHYKHINELTKIFSAPNVKSALGNTGIMIIDDEADQASLNRYARKNSKSENWEDDEFSSTYTSIIDLRAVLPNQSYLQYTATPQAPLLIDIMDLLSPKFHVMLTPGKGYVGGKTFFKERPELVINIPDNEVYHFKKNNLKNCPQSLMDALKLFLMNVAIVVHIRKQEHFLSMLVHADREQDASRIFYKWVMDLLNNWQERLAELPKNDPSRTELIAEFKTIYPEAIKSICNPPSFDLVMEHVTQVSMDCNTVLVISSNTKKSSEINWYNYSAHILVGAEMLNRGYTVEGLAVSYMPRYTIGRANADTIQQRCRFFGYKKNFLDSCRVYLPKSSVQEYVDYVEHEEILRLELKDKSLEEFEQLLILKGNINPTRSNILTKDIVNTKLSGWRQYDALQHLEENRKFIENFKNSHHFEKFTEYQTEDRKHLYLRLEIDEIIKFIKEFKIANVPDTLRKSSTIQYLKYFAETTNLKYGYVFVMAASVAGGRERSLYNGNGRLKINNIFAGPAPAGDHVYPGDRKILVPDFFCIQIHKIKLLHETFNWDKELIYTLGIYYPDHLSHSFVALRKT